MAHPVLRSLVLETRILCTDRPESLTEAVTILRGGGLVAFPTDTVYGVGALAFNPQGIEQLYVVKEREALKAIPVLLGDPTDLEQVAAEMGEAALRLAQRFWPGPLTLVVPRHPSLPENISPIPTIGVRMPNHPVALALLRLVGPLATTSANLSGGESTITAQEVYAQLGGRIPLILDGGQTPGGIPSTVVDCAGPHPAILRAGPISLAEILFHLS